ncbi:Trp biosynthesis-associated membrane protein [Solwaraspora sp. WMMD1047]|uniref:Trp biosynthesis-associated membrane protein n=1 Tax=Solwaraspora sp. WMMD1047 TaxID=3016102 RepID=UPI002417C533|nr:Trp biosynthesis-associated membrane protein [Solwaraspora sp. WMMD1047]MDG4832058.1 Trp biosynthesis-associated membrane protein [Solwaraspora sp. WMMD1047]
MSQPDPPGPVDRGAPGPPPQPAATGVPAAVGGPADPVGPGDAGGPDEPGRGGRRLLAYAVGVCLVGAGLALFAATRTWAVEVTLRPTPLPAVRTDRTGGDLLPWLPALALVGLAGAGAVLATRATARRLIGLLLVAAGVGMAVGAVTGLGDTDRGGIGPLWPLAALLGAGLTAAAGAVTAAHGHRWPTMGARYERRSGRRRPERADRADRTAGRPTDAADNAGSARVTGRRTTEVWDALDRGEDPTG